MKNIKSCGSYSCRLFIAGDINIAKMVCGHYCRETGWCVTVTPTDYIYSGGQESGVIIEAISYARFAKPDDDFKEEIRKRMENLAERLSIEMNQKSYSIMDDFLSEYYQVSMPFEK